ncbi:MAG: GntR family transcriptional regulator [Galactobacter sp.]
MIDDSRPLFMQIAEQVEDSIVDGTLVSGDRAPSTTELAAFHRINPATAAKGVNLLVDKNVLVKRRGVGMFVAPEARQLLLGERRASFARNYIGPLLAEARKLGLSPADVTRLFNEQAATGD